MVIYVLEMEDVEVVFFGSWFHVFSASTGMRILMLEIVLVSL